jgi:Na+:H+ antiporter, NhaA family
MAREPVPAAIRTWLQAPVDVGHDHIRRDPTSARAISVVIYGDYLCPYCRRLRPIIARLREMLGGSLRLCVPAFSE